MVILKDFSHKKQRSNNKKKRIPGPGLWYPPKAANCNSCPVTLAPFITSQRTMAPWCWMVPGWSQLKPQQNKLGEIFVGQWFFLIDPKGKKALRNFIAPSFKRNRTMVVVKDPQEETGPFVVMDLCSLVALSHPFRIWSWQQAQPKTHRVEAPDQTAQRTRAQTNRKVFRHARRHHNLSNSLNRQHLVSSSMLQTSGTFAFWTTGIPGGVLGVLGVPFCWVKNPPTVTEADSKRPWKWMVGIRSSPFWGPAYVQVRCLLVSGTIKFFCFVSMFQENTGFRAFGGLPGLGGSAWSQDILIYWELTHPLQSPTVGYGHVGKAFWGASAGVSQLTSRLQGNPNDL